MSGNVWEWTDSWYDKKQKYRVLRGGSWDDIASHLRVSFRFLHAPVYRNGLIGFRCVQ
jgi:formylglycine-generating enzyme required for sulfatase activity